MDPLFRVPSPDSDSNLDSKPRPISDSALTHTPIPTPYYMLRPPPPAAWPLALGPATAGTQPEDGPYYRVLHPSGTADRVGTSQSRPGGWAGQ